MGRCNRRRVQLHERQRGLRSGGPASPQDHRRKIKIIDSKWAFKRKTDENVKTKYKTRLVIRGFKDRKEYEHKETYAPVSRLPVLRSALAIINRYNLKACQIDVMTILNGLNIPEEVRKTKVCKLRKALYGLKMSSKRWNVRFSEEVEKLGLENSEHEPCLFTWTTENDLALIVLYIDDILIANNKQKNLKR